ncbi:transcriptional regulator TyrR [Erwinia tasmaniensis]|uniref:HTH-type transcriptional regulatory protein TyrR n=1 Tax=Erwinia tasmaniensis (strain DSM 17950 / CFBP 7177 / CIP 109463 / NCPPB 4357 / Et1/99) TaxID=465817 RepID=B2VKR1_ERWT9|nr:transcriptional regulator TyrR [Erwinia tasmaniensis]CAO96691.1 Transcriptional regulatory protein TyrR [Erwinia tasmaniensis Et1/99]
MRLEVFCQDRIGLTRELLDLLVERSIDLRGIEISAMGRIYLNFSNLGFDSFSQLMAEIRRIAGVTDVRTVSYLPSEREHRALSALLVALPEPVFSIDLKSKIELANPAAQALFALNEEKMRNHNAGSLISSFNFQRWLESERIEPQAHHVVLQGRDFLMEVTPVYAQDEGEAAPNPVGGVVLLKSTARMGQQLQKLAVNDDSDFQHIVAVSPKMRQVVDQARKLAMLDAPLLIVGDTGTGKDMLAAACHMRSARGKKPFLALNCASLPDDVAESELFGHAAGAYPNALQGKKGFFEQASGGSVLLDEIGEMSPRMQTKLLRFLNDGTFRRVGEEHEVHVDVRVICATQKNLLELVQRGDFREDLFYRLNVLTLTLPPLRDRPQDILPLTEMLVARFADELGVARPKLSSQLNAFLTRYTWPGNVRQLKNSLYRALTQLEGTELRPQDIVLPDHVMALTSGDEAIEGSLDEITSRFECSILTRLYLSYPSTRKLAKRLGVSHTAIANKLREYGISQKKSRED